ncbi:Mercuric ion reductase [Saccharolobus shibatae]|uniref:Mercuric ion reductase n=1 Tax=Saccharolobus shibatae TaxID=2286 RepID=A0A8F5C1G0_9CREN|nr:Mercuric ion reductase [Saccharolobus shibatae]
MKELPSSLLVIGGGAIGLEIGQALARLGSEVTVVEAMGRILPTPYFEPEISLALKDYLEDEGLDIYTNSTVTAIYKEGGRKMAEIRTRDGKERLVVDEILIATGRKPNTESLGLENAGIATDQKGYIITDKFLKTSNPIVYAAGDCIAKSLMLETLAAKEGVTAATNAIKGDISTIDYSTTPIVVFTDPQVASVGITEDELMRREKVCSCRVLKLDYVAKARLIGDTRGFIKLVVNPKDSTIVGVHALSPLASEIIMEGVMIIKNRIRLEELIDTTHVFPTISESIKLAAQSFIRDPFRMSCCVE